MPKQYFDQTRKYFDHSKKYFVDNEQEEAPLKKDKEPASVISRNFTRKQDLKPIQSAHITVDDRGDTMTGGVSVRAIEDFRERAKTRIRHHEIRTVTPSGVSISEQVCKDGRVSLTDAGMYLNNNLFFEQTVKGRTKNTCKPLPPSPPKMLKWKYTKQELGECMEYFRNKEKETRR